MKNLKMHSKSLIEDNILRIREIFPNCVTEALDQDGNLNVRVNFEQLQQELSETLVEGQQERYQLNWPGNAKQFLILTHRLQKLYGPSKRTHRTSLIQKIYILKVIT